MGCVVILQQLVWLAIFIVIVQCVPQEPNPLDLMDELNNNTTYHSNSSRVYHGYLSQIRYNFMVAIMSVDDNGNGTLICGGTLLNSKWVLTIGHCIPALKNLIGINRAQAWIGAQNIGISENTNIRQQIIIKGYREPTPSYDVFTRENDIALLELQTPVNWSNNDFGVICIGTRNYDDYNNIRLIGWGANTCKNPTPYLTAADGYTLTNEDCQTKYNDVITIQPTMICAYVRGKPDKYSEQAPGDGGGPIFYTNDNENTVQIGIVSFNKILPDGSKCPDPKYPGVYTRTASYVSWIKSVVGHLNTCI